MNKPISNVFNIDCIKGMKEHPDNYFELAIVDPPYGIGADFGVGRYVDCAPHIIKKKWDNKILEKSYFSELFRISKNQIIWGGNYFLDYLPSTKCMIYWLKPNLRGRCFADGEIAWTSFDKVSRLFEKSSIDNNRFHPTQKPIALYKWLLKNYAKPGDKIIDTHLGSGSSRIAAYDMGHDFTGYELDKDYFEAMEKRFEEHTKQQTFNFEAM